MQKGRATLDLSVAQFREIGRIIVAFATMEWHLKILLHKVVGLDGKRGRLAIREPRVNEYPALIGDILSLENKKLPPEAENLGSELKDAEARRNALAHGVWIRLPSHAAPLLQHTKENWESAPPPKIAKRKINPEGIPLTVEDLRKQHASILATLKRVIRFSRAVRALTPLPKKSDA